ncbi:MAG: AmmeMemoRadiSam system protein A [bacterium]
MPKSLSRQDGMILVDLAKKAIESVFLNDSVVADEDTKKRFSEPSGVFVTIHKYGKLRGCIGYARSGKPLYETVINAAKSAAFQDTRFMPLSKDEFAKVEIEVSLITNPIIINKENPVTVLNNIKVGKDGIMIKNSNFSGLLLPQAAVESAWSSEDLLKYACNKFGLNEKAWLDPESKLYKFRAQVFTD